MELTPLGGRMASQQQRPRHQQEQEPKQQLGQERRQQDRQQASEKHVRKPQLPSSPPIERMMLCPSVPSSSNSSSTTSTTTCTSDSAGSKHSHSRNAGSQQRKSPSPIAFASITSPSPESNRVRGEAEERLIAPPSVAEARRPEGESAAATASLSCAMQRHRKKDRSDRAPPTIQKYLQLTGGVSCGTLSPGALVVPVSENLYQPCGGVSLSAHSAATGDGGHTVTSADTVAPSPEAGCCRQGGDLFTGPGGYYPENNPDSIEVYRGDKQQQGGVRIVDVVDPCAGVPGPCHQYRSNSSNSKWCEEASNLGGNTMSLHHHHHHHHGDGTPPAPGQGPCDSSGTEHHQQHHSSVPGGSAEYSYAYCEPILLQQRTMPTDGPLPSCSASGPSPYCVPVYVATPRQRGQQQQQQQQQPMPPALPLAQQKSLRSIASLGARTPYAPQYPTGGGRGSTAATTLHHHHHHHHHNYTLPNSSSSSSGSSKSIALPPHPAAAASTTTTTGSLRALFTNIFRKSAASSPSAAAVAAAAAAAIPLNAAPSAPLFVDGAGGGETLRRSSGLLLAGAERHSFTTCYGTKENIYEDIGSQSGLVVVGPPAGAPTAPTTPAPTPTNTTTSTVTGAPLPPPPPLPPTAGSPLGTAGACSLAAEWERVQVQHERIIGELNLSVERLIMPSYDDEHHGGQEVPPPSDGGDPRTLAPRICHRPTAPTSHPNACSSTSSSSAKRLFTPPSSSSSPPSSNQALVVVERHSPTISYGKSYGDVDSGISSSSTSGTSYSSSILYRSITNYQQQQQQQQQQHQHPGLDGVHAASLVVGVGQQQHQFQPQHRKVTLFGLRPPGFASGGRLGGSCRVTRDQHGPLTTGGPDSPSGVGPSVTNAPDPPPPPDTVALHSSSAHTLASCCFFAEQQQFSAGVAGPARWGSSSGMELELGGPGFGSSRDRFRSERSSGGGGNFWTRFRKLPARLGKLSGGGGGGASQQEASSFVGGDGRPDLEDFAPAGPLWPLHQYHQYHGQPSAHPHHHQHLPPLQLHSLRAQQPPPVPASRSEPPLSPAVAPLLQPRDRDRDRDRDLLSYPFPPSPTPSPSQQQPPATLPSGAACGDPTEPRRIVSSPGAGKRPLQRQGSQSARAQDDGVGQHQQQQEEGSRRSPSSSPSSSSVSASSAASTGSSRSSASPTSPSSAGSSSSSSAKLSGGIHNI